MITILEEPLEISRLSGALKFVLPDNVVIAAALVLGASPPKAREKTGRPDFFADFLMLACSKKILFAWQNIREHVHRGTACAPNMHVPAHANEQWNPGKRGKFQNPCLNLASGKLWSN